MVKEKRYPALNDYVILFMLFAMFGWLYETFLEVVVYGWGFSNRGLMHGPYLPIYGFGGVILMLLFYRLIVTNKKIPVLLRVILFFVGVVLVSTVLELVTSYILEWLTGSWPWQSYENYALNFGGRIAMSTSLRFGLLGLICVWTLVPLEKYISKKWPEKTKNIVAGCIVVIIVTETVLMVAGI